jgi:REP element-mobilizing transposase RayT
MLVGVARHLRVEFPGAIYHVACRMIGDGRLDQSRLFVDDKDRQRFVDRLADRVEQYNIRLYLFVCMTNHFHLVFETPEANCSKFMCVFRSNRPPSPAISATPSERSDAG